MSRSKAVFFLIIGGSLLFVFIASAVLPGLQTRTAEQAVTATAQFAKNNLITVTANYETSKERWFRDAIERFHAANPNIKISLVAQGSMQGYQTLSQVRDTTTSLPGNNVVPALYAPASSMQVNLLNAVSNNAYSRNLAIECKQLVLSPNIIMIWEDRAKVFEAYYKDKGGITLANLVDALDPQGKVKGRWENLGGSANWGFIKVGHTDPSQSNGGLMTIMMFANNFYAKTNAVSTQEVTAEPFLTWMGIIEGATTKPLLSSTGLFADDVIAKGPAAYDFVMVYEAMGIEHYKNATGRHGQALRFVYPAFNMYTNHPLCLIDHPTVTTVQRDAARKFQEFLLSPDIQKLSLKYGWRPADLSVPIFGAGTDFDSPELKSAGISTNVGQELQVPDGDTINQLISSWRRTAPR